MAWLAELLSAHSDARHFQEILALTRDTITARQETVDTTQNQYDAGAATEYELAEAALYPSLSLSGTIGRVDGVVSWGFGPQISLSVFNQGQLRASRDAKISVAAAKTDSTQAWVSLKITIGAGAAHSE